MIRKEDSSFRIVGNADGGKMMSEKEYEEFKKSVRGARMN